MVCQHCMQCTCWCFFLLFTVTEKDPLFILRGKTIPTACAPHDTLTLHRHCLYVYGVSALHAVHRLLIHHRHFLYGCVVTAQHVVHVQLGVLYLLVWLKKEAMKLKSILKKVLSLGFIKLWESIQNTSFSW